MGTRGTRDGRLRARRGARAAPLRLVAVRTAAVRTVAVLLLGLGGLFGLGLTPALAAAPAPPPAPAPYGGLLDAPEPGSTFADEQVLEIGMLTLGSLNALAFVGAIIIGRSRGPSTEQTRHALMARTSPGVPSGGRRRRKPRRPAPAPSVLAPPAPAADLVPALRPLVPRP